MSQPAAPTASTPPPSLDDPSSAPKPEIPWAFIDCSAETLVILISHMLNLLIEHNDQVVLTPDALTRFHSRAAPGISVIEYLRRIVKYTNMEKIPLLSLLAYIDLTCAHLPTFTLSTLTVHRFLIAGVCAGSKAQCDVFCTNSHYAKVGGIKVQELNALEREFLRVTQWNLCCNADLLQRYYTSLIRSHGGFTQAAAPDVPPFRSFPRSVSKPRTPDDDPEDPMDGDDADAEGDAAEGNEDEDMGGDGDLSETVGGSSGGEGSGIAGRRKSVDEVLGVAVRGAGGLVYERGRRRRSSLAMDVELENTDRITPPSPPPQPQYELSSIIPSEPLGQAQTHTNISPPSTRGSPISPASSSIPSSSRSSIRLAGGGRVPSLTNLSGGGRPAEAIVDRRNAGLQGTSTPDVLGGQVVGVPIPDAGRGRPSGSRARDIEGDGAHHDEPEMYEEEMGEGQAVNGDTGGQHAGTSSTGPGHGRLLKNLVGVFRKRSSVPPPSHPPSDSTPIPQSGHRPQSIIHSRPLSSATLPPHSAQSHSNPPSARTSALPRHTGPEAHQTPSSPRDAGTAQQMMSPGLPTSVTPRIRTRDERSVESLRERSGVGVGVGTD